jgi:protein-S-isoprenylcysteine O-methyltransferase Ste14
MEKLSFYGVGPKIGRVTLPYLAVSIALTVFFPEIFGMGGFARLPFLIAGGVLILFALVFYFSTLKLMLPGIKENRLITGGAYRFCRNPLYSAIILFLIPGIGLAANSWLIITTSLVGFLMFRISVREEENMLERIFGDEYRRYREKTPLFFPNPFAG